MTYGLKELRISIPTDKCDLAYLAGILDGEGCISWNKDYQKTGRLSPQLSVANTNRELMDWLSKIGGSVRVTVRTARNPSWLPLFFWRVCGSRNILALLEALLPYLIVKRAKAMAAIEIITDRIANPRTRLGPRAKVK